MVSESSRRRNFLPASAHLESYSRRVFLERAITLGIAGAASDILLTDCGPSPADTTGTRSSSKPTTIFWSSENDEVGVCNKLATHYNLTNNDNITVIQTGNQVITDLLTQLKSSQKTPDVLSLDVIWIDEFASSNLISPLGNLWKEQIHDEYLPFTLKSVTFANEIWAAPFRTDIGLLFYRKDLVPAPPATWDELVAMAQQALAHENNKNMYGYVWEETGEGLICNFVEVLSSFGGSILDHHGNPVINQGDATIKALNMMRSWIDLSLSPRPPLLTSEEVYAEEEVGNTWAEGKAVFMRNWPYAIAMSNDVERALAIADKFAVAPLPSKAKSCLGGWQLAINKNSANQDAAWKFIKWMVGIDAQQYGALMGSFTMAREDIYAPPIITYIIERNPFFGSFKSIIEGGQPRPSTPLYQQISLSLQDTIRKVLSDLMSPETAQQAMQADLEKILSKK